MRSAAEEDLRRAFDGMGSGNAPKTEALTEEPAPQTEQVAAQEPTAQVVEATEPVTEVAEPVSEEVVTELAAGAKVKLPNGLTYPVEELTGYERLKSNFSREQQKLRQEIAKVEEERRRIQEDREFLDIAAKTPWIATGLQAIRTGADPTAAFKAAAIAGGYESVTAPTQPEAVDPRSQWPPQGITQEDNADAYEKAYADHIQWKAEQAITSKLKASEDRIFAALQERDKKTDEAVRAQAQLQAQAEAHLKTNYERLSSDLFAFLPFDISALDKVQQEQVFQKLGQVAQDAGIPLDNISMSRREYMPAELRFIAREAYGVNPFKPQPIARPVTPPVTQPFTPGQQAAQTKPSTSTSGFIGDGWKELLSLQPA